MIIDILNMFSDAQAFTATAISTNVIDLLPGTILGTPTANLQRDIGAGETLYLHIRIGTSVGTASGNTTTIFTLETDDNAALSSAVVIWTSPTFTTNASLVAGTWVAKGIALPSANYERYLGLRATISVQNWNAGNVDAWISDNRFDDRTYRPGYVTGVN